VTIGARTLLATTLIAGGWLAQVLASTDGDVDRGIEALEAGDFEAALTHFEAAEKRRGERPELEYDRGLALWALGRTEDAAKAFERGTESEDETVRSSSHYQLGNAAFGDEDYEAAIAAYEACLRALPEHQNAKWNLELALRKKKEQDEQREKEEQEQEQEDQEDQEDQDQEDQDQEDQEDQDQENQDQETQDQETQDQENQDQENQDQENQDKEDQEKEQEQEQEQEQQGQDQQESEQDSQGKPDAPPPAPEPKAFDEADLDKALEQLDEEDRFMLGRPNAPRRPVEKDW